MNNRTPEPRFLPVAACFAKQKWIVMCAPKDPNLNYCTFVKFHSAVNKKFIWLMAQIQIKLSVNCHLQPILHYDVFLSGWNLILSVVTQLDYAMAVLHPNIVRLTALE